MNKQQLVRELVNQLNPRTGEERSRLTAYHMGRSIPAIRESLSRWGAINSTPQAECRKHCQLNGLARLGK
jgi:hypothetical protein